MRTHHVNRSKLLVAILAERGWQPAAEDAVADLAMWDPYRTTPRTGRLATLEPRDANRMDDKRRLFRALADAGCAGLMPETWLSLDDWRAAAPAGGPWFVKASHLSGGRGINCVADEAGIAAALAETPGRCVIQRSVADPWLLDDRKFTVRTYVLWRGAAPARVFAESLLIVQPARWNPADLDPEVQFRHRTPSYVSSDDWPDHPAVHMRLVEATRRTLGALGPSLSASGDAGRYQLLGVDFLPDAAGTPWLIEINAWPNLGWRERHTQRALKQRMLADFAGGVAATLDGRDDGWGRFEAI